MGQKGGRGGAKIQIHWTRDELRSLAEEVARLSEEKGGRWQDLRRWGVLSALVYHVQEQALDAPRRRHRLSIQSTIGFLRKRLLPLVEAAQRKRRKAAQATLLVPTAGREITETDTKSAVVAPPPIPSPSLTTTTPLRCVFTLDVYGLEPLTERLSQALADGRSMGLSSLSNGNPATRIADAMLRSRLPTVDVEAVPRPRPPRILVIGLLGDQEQRLTERLAGLPVELRFADKDKGYTFEAGTVDAAVVGIKFSKHAAKERLIAQLGRDRVHTVMSGVGGVEATIRWLINNAQQEQQERRSQS